VSKVVLAKGSWHSPLDPLAGYKKHQKIDWLSLSFLVFFSAVQFAVFAQIEVILTGAFCRIIVHNKHDFQRDKFCI